ncbi:hypothetical protein PILCRDRAFT_727243 [Piloderma croceum F 1598]|uniref:Uncharacterized protein n=1 Tax=Piloderma croceum (strain F 1598) TaxID=765440 RepID=A0A0C3B825_PILCF|nr:hypothetical protein PILCRDRAFT_727243 [Piloderma croceum F 1598]
MSGTSDVGVLGSIQDGVHCHTHCGCLRTSDHRSNMSTLIRLGKPLHETVLMEGSQRSKTVKTKTQ